MTGIRNNGLDPNTLEKAYGGIKTAAIAQVIWNIYIFLKNVQ